MTTKEFFDLVKNKWPIKDVSRTFLEGLDLMGCIRLTEILNVEPGVFDGDKKQRSYYCSLIDYYCSENRLTIPRWTLDEKYNLSEIYYPFNNSSELKNSLEEFKDRNIVVLKEDLE